MDWKEKSFGPMESLRFRNHAGLLMSQKWMNFNKVSKGVCTHTVSIAGYCLDRRVLGSFLFGLISYKTPPQPFNAKGAISLGWKKFKFYNRDQPHFSQHENFNKIPKFFTYAASQLGYSFGEKNTNILSMNGKKFKARFKNSIENYEKALKKLHEFLSEPIVNDRDRAGIIKAFEFTFELSWKTIQKICQEEQLEAGGPRSIIKHGFSLNIIENEICLQALFSS